jgi:hypothetical protein
MLKIEVDANGRVGGTYDRNPLMSGSPSSFVVGTHGVQCLIFRTHRACVFVACRTHVPRFVGGSVQSGFAGKCGCGMHVNTRAEMAMHVSGRQAG